jgi:putative acetyltransferase
VATPDLDALEVRPFDRCDQDVVRELVLEGLLDHWGVLDPNLNTDLDDIASNDGDAVVLVAWIDELVVGTGTLRLHDDMTAEIVRMSVRRSRRANGIGTMILEALLDEARQRGCRRVVLETTADWHDVVRFYRKCGFELTHFEDGQFSRDAHFALDLSPS